MRKYVLTAVCLGLIFSEVNSQRVFAVNYPSQADIKVWVAPYEHQADLKVYKVPYQHQADDNTGKWFFTAKPTKRRKKFFL